MRRMEEKVSKWTIVNEILQFFWQTEWWWLTPFIVVMLLFGALIILAQSSAVAPFIYTLF